MIKVTVVLLVPVLGLALVHSDASAQAATFSAAHWVMAGVLLVDVIASSANAVTLMSATGNRPLGYFGIAAGAVSLGLVGLDLALEDNRHLRDSFALAYGVAGTTSLVLGVVNVRRDRPSGDNLSWLSAVSFFPYLTVERDGHCQMGVGARLAF